MSKDDVKWHRRFLKLAHTVASWSKDPSTKVGAVLVNDTGLVVGMGYNGFPRGVDDSPERYFDRPTKYKFVVHAEVNAIINAGHAAKGTTLYVWPPFGLPPLCTDCMKLVIQAGVKRIITYRDTPRDDWAESIAVSRIMAQEAGIECLAVEKQNDL